MRASDICAYRREFIIERVRNVALRGKMIALIGLDSLDHLENTSVTFQRRSMKTYFVD
jgi:hypothetical protein